MLVVSMEAVSKGFLREEDLRVDLRERVEVVGRSWRG